MATAGQAAEMTASSTIGPVEVKGFYSGVVEVRDGAIGRVSRIDLGPGAIWKVGILAGRFLVAGRRMSTLVYDIERSALVLERPEPLMGVAPDASLYFTSRLDPNQPALLFYRLPDGPPDLTWTLDKTRTVDWYDFSPDLRYLVLEVVAASVRDDVDLLFGDDHRKARQPHYRMLDLVQRREINEFAEEEILYRGRFTDSGDAYVLSRSQVVSTVTGRQIGRFDLMNRRWIP